MKVNMKVSTPDNHSIEENNNAFLETVSSPNSQDVIDNIDRLNEINTSSNVSNATNPNSNTAIPIKKTKKERKDKHTFECCICLNTKTKKEDYVMTPCKHEFCCSCLLKHITSAKTCPLCRHNIVDKCIHTFEPIRIRQAVNVMKLTIDNYDFEAEYNAMAAFNDRHILTSLVKTVSVDCVRNVLQAQKEMNNIDDDM